MTLLPRVVKSEAFWIPLELSAMKGLGPHVDVHIVMI